MPPYIDILGDRLKVGDSCFVRAEGDVHNTTPFIAKLQRLDADDENGGYQCTVQWYYRPEDPGIPGGRKSFHGEQELYVSDHRVVIHSETALGRCEVHSLECTAWLQVVRPQDYYSRFHFNLKTRTFSPETVVVHCTCKQPENPDRPMSQCDACKEWFHPSVKLAAAGANGSWAAGAALPAVGPPQQAAAQAGAQPPPAPDPRLAALQAQLQQLGGGQRLGTPPPMPAFSQPLLSGSLLAQQLQQQPQQQQRYQQQQQPQQEPQHQQHQHQQHQQLDMAGWLAGPAPPPGSFTGLSAFGFL
ncbi:BAH-PHD domain-containing [Micractinium conductrix]|uniref:BAH-PHD domain-containing n=1 Tax=Micractinium conductrix TaxID=554055 RepID=A0A2P6VGW4_9CHLO|nr:BAH-PHD domain-containing [Micractinium conductrix]|eukprot:PSC73332.1 BAH-PHD domain-containing [Micractinium conductrix]